MTDGKGRIDELASLMKEFGLNEATWENDGFRITLKKRSASAQAAVQPSGESHTDIQGAFHTEIELDEPAAPEVPKGSPITSPMNGIFYTAPSPNAAPFVKEGDSVTAGQVIGLIEAMKVFNELTSNFSGVVRQVVAESGHVVQPGEVLMYIG